MKASSKRTLKIVLLILAAVLLVAGAYFVHAENVRKQADYEEIKGFYESSKQENAKLLEKLDELTRELDTRIAENKDLSLKVAELEKKNEDVCRRAYLTFDDGPSVNTTKILDILKEKGVKATFFVIGKTDDFSKDVYNRIVAEGHVLALHSMTHNYSAIYKNVDAFKADYKALSDLLYEKTSMRPTVMRFPGGSNNTVSKKYGGEIMDELVKEMPAAGYVYYDWNVDSGDALSKKLTADQITARVVEQSAKKSDAVILMHDAKPKEETVKALPEIISKLSEMGFSFEVLTEKGPDVRFKK